MLNSKFVILGAFIIEFIWYALAATSIISVWPENEYCKSKEDVWSGLTTLPQATQAPWPSESANHLYKVELEVFNHSFPSLGANGSVSDSI